MKTPERTTAAAYPLHLKGQVVADSAALHWPGLFVRRYKFPRVVDRFLVPATPEPLISCQIKGSAVFKERDLGGNWLTHQLLPGTLFVTRSRTPYEVSFSSPPGEELENVQIHVSVDVFLAAVEAAHPGKAETIDVIDFFGRDEALAHLCFACAEMLVERVPAKSERVTYLTMLIASCVAEKYTTAAAEKADFRGGLPVRQLRKVEDFRARTPGRRHFARVVSRAGRAKSLSLLARLQADDRHVAAAIRHPRTDHARPATHPRDEAQSDRDRPRRRVQEPKPFCAGLPAGSRCDAERVSERVVTAHFPARTQQSAQ